MNKVILNIMAWYWQKYYSWKYGNMQWENVEL